MKLIPVSKGHFAKVDDEDYEYLSKWKWTFDHGYAVRNDRRNNGKRKRIYMHQQITGFGVRETDHKNQDKLDNQRNNLRHCTHSLNHMNIKIRSNNACGYKGVFYAKYDKRWLAKITVNKKVIRIGEFKTPEEAAHAYDEMAIKLVGEFACCNFPRFG